MMILELIQYKHPYYKASEDFKHTFNKFDPNIKNKISIKLQEFKSLKTLNPQNLIPSPNWKDHALRGNLSHYYEAHLIYGQISLIYYHGGRYLLLMAIVPHNVLTSTNKSNVLESQLNSTLNILKKQVETKLAYWDNSGIANTL